MLTDFGILKIDPAHPHTDERVRERAFLLMNGAVRIEWKLESAEGREGEEGSVEIERHDLLEQEPVVVHVPLGTAVTISTVGGVAELAVQAVLNPVRFPPRIWSPGEYRSERFGEGILEGTSTRVVRTFFDAATAPWSQMVLGEVVNFPGRWSSYPPHFHAQPEIYHFRFFPDQGFGFSEQGDDVFKVQSRDTVTIPPRVVHPQTSAPGYTMYYIWMIPHLPNDRFGPDSRIFTPEHEWVLNPPGN
jgi:5-deoxy-glucuronate isomerase